MENKLERYFNSYKVRDDLKIDCIVEYEKIEKELQNKSLKIIDIDKNYISKLVLPWVLIDYGYTYAGKYIFEEIRKNKENSYFKIASMIKDIRGVEDFKIDEINPFKNKEEIVFVKELGYFEEFEIEFSCDQFPVRINYVSNRLEKYIKTEIINGIDKSIVKVRFSIPRYEDINNFEDIVVHTSYKTNHYGFVVRSESDYLLEGDVDEKALDRSIISKVYKAKNIEEILEIIKIYENETKTELSLDVYMKILKHAFSYREFNIRLALFCEELFLKHPLAFDGILDYLKEMYNKNILTDNSGEIIDYMKLLLDDSITSKGALINLKEFKGEIDSEFIREVKNIYKLTKQKDIFNKIINKIVNRIGVKYDLELINIVYEFYKRTGDIRSLIVIIENCDKIKFDIEKLGFNINDRVKLLDFYKRNKKYDIKYIIKFIYPYIDESGYIKKNFIYVFKDILNNKTNMELQDIINKYNYVFEKILIYDDSIYLRYIENLVQLDRKINIELFKNTFNKFNSSKYTGLRLKLIKKIIEYYISNGDENEYIKYLNIYLENYEKYDKSNLVLKIIKDNKDDVILLSIIVNRVRFKTLEDKKRCLLAIKELFIKSNRYDLLLNIMYEFKGIKEYYECYKILKKYIPNLKYISKKTYSTLIKVVFDNIEKQYKHEMFNLLVSREDFPIEFRIKCLSLFKSKENEKFIVRAFREGKTSSRKAKELVTKEI